MNSFSVLGDLLKTRPFWFPPTENHAMHIKAFLFLPSIWVISCSDSLSFQLDPMHIFPHNPSDSHISPSQCGLSTWSYIAARHTSPHHTAPFKAHTCSISITVPLLLHCHKQCHQQVNKLPASPLVSFENRSAGRTKTGKAAIADTNYTVYLKMQPVKQ